MLQSTHMLLFALISVCAVFFPNCHTPHTAHYIAIHEETELSRWVGGGADCQKVHETLHDGTPCIHPEQGSQVSLEIYIYYD